MEFTKEEIEGIKVAIDDTLLVLGANEDEEEIKLLEGILKKLEERG